MKNIINIVFYKCFNKTFLRDYRMERRRKHKDTHLVLGRKFVNKFSIEVTFQLKKVIMFQ